MIAIEEQIELLEEYENNTYMNYDGIDKQSELVTGI